MTAHEIWDRVYFGNSVFIYARFVVIGVLGFISVGVIRFVVMRRLTKWAEKTETQIDDFIIGLVNRIGVPLLYLSVLHVALKSLMLSMPLNKAISGLTLVVVVAAGLMAITSLIRFFLFSVYAKKFPDHPELPNRLQAVMPAITIVVWIIGIVFLLDNLGFQVSAIVAGLGIGGVAVALAASVILTDLFAYFAIVFDRPFVIGDFIITDDFKGTVERIGIKTTRIRSLSGELLVFPNKNLTDSRLRNYKIMEQRRIEFRLGVTYDTSLEKLKEISLLLRSIVEKHPKTRFDRAHFSSYGDFSLNFEVVYFVLSSDYNVYMDIQQSINFAIKEEFDRRHIDFAYPTQTLYHYPIKQGEKI